MVFSSFPGSTFLSHLGSRLFSTSRPASHIIKLTRLRVVDNSALGKQAMMDGKPPRCIHVYNKTGIGTVGDKILVTIKGQKKKALIVGVRQRQKCFVPRFDSNNIVLIDDNGNPLGTRVHVPVPSMLRGKKEFSKVLALCTSFV
ncbi:39S ribosomal protein L14, mitochondrial-like [Limulus polyphemus]|uniref:Large ribosomal subunit protein uL14m n=1 Tax=Limulus polyphemus TaxID=6850 RepID=A0ABM1S0S0_LIMPO|nr:39S ribosomal protein L14, mitochondrial-like [Limulus polyphemus]XP_022237225.1 39S ribosomal protein L14, mitochondrial-like [Limulus polyphemus]XP_022237227.1 39S ribosomal protein L14, mitochondrial-like [Limulus polyphemus]